MEFPPPPKMGFGAANIGYALASGTLVGDALQPSLADCVAQLGHPGMLADHQPPSSLLDPSTLESCSAAPGTVDLNPPPTPITTDPTKQTTIALELLHPRPPSRPQARAHPLLASTGHAQRRELADPRVRRLKLTQRLPGEAYKRPHAIIYFDSRGYLRGVASEDFLHCTDRLSPAVRHTLGEALRAQPVRRSQANGQLVSNAARRRRHSLAETVSNSTEEEDFVSHSQDLGYSGTRNRIRRASRHHYHNQTVAGQSSDACDFDMDDSSDDDGPAAPEVRSGEEIQIGDEAKVKAFYEERFKLLQQIPCKSIAKDWIKIIEPKKQATHPYNGGKAAKERKNEGNPAEDPGELTKPAWWPPTGCPHKEPDHIDRKERLALLMWLLRGIWDPEATHGYQTTSVQKLRASTEKTVQTWERQDKYEENGIWLNDIYRMREQEEQFRRGEIDASASLFFYSVSIPSRGSGKRKRPSKGRSSDVAAPMDGSSLAVSATNIRPHQSGYIQSGSSFMPPPTGNIQYNQVDHHVSAQHEGRFGQVSASPLSTISSSEGPATMNTVSSATTPQSASFRRDSSHASTGTWGSSAGRGNHVSPYSYTTESSHSDLARAVPSLSPAQKRSMGTMNHGVAMTASASGPFSAIVPPADHQRRQQDTTFPRTRSTTDYNQAAGHGFHAIRPSPFSSTQSNSSQSSRREDTDSTSLTFPSTAHSDAPALLPNGQQWQYMQSQSSAMSDVNTWSGTYSYNDYNNNMTSPTQTSNVNRMMHDVQLQPIASGYPYPSQQEYSMTSPGWNTYHT